MSSKRKNFNSELPAAKSSYSTGTRGESAVSRNIAGNHNGNRAKSTRKPKSH